NWGIATNSGTSEIASPLRRPPTGVARGRPETRPVVSRTVWNGSLRSTGLIRRWTALAIRYLRAARDVMPDEATRGPRTPGRDRCVPAAGPAGTPGTRSYADRSVWTERARPRY